MTCLAHLAGGRAGTPVQVCLIRRQLCKKVHFYSFESLLAVEGETLLGVGKGAACPLDILLLGWAPEPWWWGLMTLLDRRLQVSTFLKVELPGCHLACQKWDNLDLLITVACIYPLTLA